MIPFSGCGIRLIQGTVSIVQKPTLYIRHGLTGADQLVFIGCQSFQPHGTACVNFAGCDANLRTEAINKTIGETGGNIPVDAGAVDLIQEESRGGFIICDNTVS